MTILDHTGRPIQNKTPFEEIDQITAKAWYRAMLRDISRGPFYRDFLFPLIVDQYGNSLTELKTLCPCSM